MASQTGITEESLRAALLEGIPIPNPENQAETIKVPVVHAEVTDESSGCGQSFSALVVSDAFKGMMLRKRAQVINKMLKSEIEAVHAWSVTCKTPAEWEKMKA